MSLSGMHEVSMGKTGNCQNKQLKLSVKRFQGISGLLIVHERGTKLELLKELKSNGVQLSNQYSFTYPLEQLQILKLQCIGFAFTYD